jgi:acetyl-CoA carboxylase biotin carboxyl carrier protein
MTTDYAVPAAASAAPAPVASAPPSTQPAPPAAYPQTTAPAAPVSGKPSDAADPNQVLVRSPIVGTYYEAAAPGAPSFVRVGDAVEPGQVLCIIESMKLMNEIEAEVAGVITAKLVENGRPVEYGEALFSIRPR